MSGENVEIKSKYERDFRRFSSTRESLTKYSDLIQLLKDAHGLPAAMDIAVSYQDPLGDLVPLRDDTSLSTAVLTASEPLLRLFVHMRSGQWNTEYWSGEEDESGSDASESSFSDQENGPCKDAEADAHCKDAETDAHCKDAETNAHCKDAETDGHCKDQSASQTATCDDECTKHSQEGRTEDTRDGLSTAYGLPLHPLLTGSITDDVTTETDSIRETDSKADSIRETDSKADSKVDPEGREMSAVMDDMLPQHPLLKLFTGKQQNNKAPIHQLSSLTLEQSTPTKCEDSTASDKFDYVIEIYDFDSTLKTKDLLEEFRRDYGKHEFRLKWVDDTHALGIFASGKQAWLAAKAPYSKFKTRLLSEGIEQSLTVAERVAEDMRPCGSMNPPPKRTAMVARRMVASALGVKVAINPEKREREREELEKAREEKRVLKSTIH